MGGGAEGSRQRRERHDINNSRGFNMYEASGQWSTTHSQPQPLLSDGREQRGEEGGEEGERGLHTNHSQINSLLP